MGMESEGNVRNVARGKRGGRDRYRKEGTVVTMTEANSKLVNGITGDMQKSANIRSCLSVAGKLGDEVPSKERLILVS